MAATGPARNDRRQTDYGSWRIDQGTSGNDGGFFQYTGTPCSGAPVPAGWKLTTTQPPGEPLRLGPLRSTRCTTTAQSGSLSGQPAAGLVPAGWKSTTTASPDGLSPGARCTSSTPTVRSGSIPGHPVMGRLAPAGSKLTTTHTRAIARSSLDRAPSIAPRKRRLGLAVYRDTL